MAAWTIDDVRGVAPEFTEAQVDDSIVTAWIARAARRISEAAWGDSAKDAGAYLTAHLMAVAGLGPFAGQAHTGQVSQMVVGGVSVSYAVQQHLVNEPTLALSRFGLMFAELRAEQCFGATVL